MVKSHLHESPSLLDSFAPIVHLPGCSGIKDSSFGGGVGENMKGAFDGNLSLPFHAGMQASHIISPSVSHHVDLTPGEGISRCCTRRAKTGYPLPVVLSNSVRII